MAVTEWNIDAGLVALGPGQTGHPGGGFVATARYLNLMMRHPDKAKIACRSTSPIATVAPSSRPEPPETAAFPKRASFYVMASWSSRHAKPISAYVTSQ